MLQKYKTKRQEGFNIIEVLIVLAIAGLIILIVFLAVPALQRNSRNTQRTNDASLVSAAINECLNNNNGQMASCQDPAAASLNTYLDSSKLQQLTTEGTASISNYDIQTGTRCDANGASPVAGGGGRAFTVSYQVETTGVDAPRCIGS